MTCNCNSQTHTIPEDMLPYLPLLKNYRLCDPHLLTLIQLIKEGKLVFKHPYFDIPHYV